MRSLLPIGDVSGTRRRRASRLSPVASHPVAQDGALEGLLVAEVIPSSMLGPRARISPVRGDAALGRRGPRVRLKTKNRPGRIAVRSVSAAMTGEDLRESRSPRARRCRPRGRTRRDRARGGAPPADGAARNAPPEPLLDHREDEPLRERGARPMRERRGTRASREWVGSKPRFRPPPPRRRPLHEKRRRRQRGSLLHALEDPRVWTFSR
jgi:hypothetical protein